jgi:hypothetical protein
VRFPGRRRPGRAETRSRKPSANPARRSSAVPVEGSAPVEWSVNDRVTQSLRVLGSLGRWQSDGHRAGAIAPFN